MHPSTGPITRGHDIDMVGPGEIIEFGSDVTEFSQDESSISDDQHLPHIQYSATSVSVTMHFLAKVDSSMVEFDAVPFIATR